MDAAAAWSEKIILKIRFEDLAVLNQACMLLWGASCAKTLPQTIEMVAEACMNSRELFDRFRFHALATGPICQMPGDSQPWAPLVVGVRHDLAEWVLTASGLRTRKNRGEGMALFLEWIALDWDYLHVRFRGETD